MVVSASGGKDSDAMLRHLLKERRRWGWTGEVHLVHADLGESEWFCTPDYMKQLAERYNVPLHIVKHNKFESLIDGCEARWDDLVRQGRVAPPWPSAAARYCTSDYKRSPISKWINNYFPRGDVVCAIGLRAQESSARAKKPLFQIRSGCWRDTRVTKSSIKPGRFVLDWHPLLYWTEDDVWNELLPVHTLSEFREVYQLCKESGLSLWDAAEFIADRYFGYMPFHPAYLAGNHRLSCALCILADLNDIINGITFHPALYNRYCRLEMKSGFSFRQNLWLCSLRPDLLDEDIREWWEKKSA